MEKLYCIDKIYGKYNRIEAYIIQDMQGNILRTTPDQLKMVMFLKQADVVNLKLTSDGRLIDREPNNNIQYDNEEQKFVEYVNKTIKLITIELSKYIQNLIVDAEGDQLRCYKGLVRCLNGDTAEININFFKTKINIYISPLNTPNSDIKANNIRINVKDTNTVHEEIKIAVDTMKTLLNNNTLNNQGVVLITNKVIVQNTLTI